MLKTTLVLQPAPLTDVPPAPPTPTNESLMELVKQGDTGAFWTLYWRHAELIRRVIGRSVVAEEAREILLQEVFQEMLDRAEHYTREKGHFLGWMVTLARRRAIERARLSEARTPAKTVPARAASRALSWRKPADSEFAGWNPAAA